MKIRHTLQTIYRCAVALMAVATLALAAGCAWLLMPITAARAADGENAAMMAKIQTAYLESRLLLASGGVDQAVAKLELTRQRPGCPPELYHALAEGYVRQRNTDKARKTLDDGLKLFPDDSELLIFDARLDGMNGDLDKSLAKLEKALAAAPHSQSVLEMMSDLRLKKIRNVKTQKELDEQVAGLTRIYERMLEGRRGLERVPVLLVLSSLTMRTNHPERSAEYAREAVQIHPREVRCHMALGQALEAAGRKDEALKSFREILLLNAENDEAREHIDKLLDEQGKPDAKSKFYGELARDYPSDKQFQIYYAQRLVEAKDWPAAETQLKAILEQWPTESKSRLELARVWVALKRTDEAVAAVERLSREDKGIAPLANLSIAEALLAQGDHARALKVLDEFEKTGSNTNDNVTLALASLLLESKEVGRAIGVLEAFHKRRPELYPATLLLLQSYVIEKRYNDAQALLTGLPEKVKKSKEAEILQLQGDLYRRQKQWDKALAAFTALMEKDKTNAQAIMDTGTVYQEQGRASEAEKLFRKAIELAPEDAETYNTLGYFYAETNQKLDEAQKLVDRAIEMKPTAGNIMDSVGWVYYRRGDYAKAVEKLQRAVELMAKTPDAVVFEHLGDAYDKWGKPAEARAAWNKALELDADSATVKGKLARTNSEQAAPKK